MWGQESKRVTSLQLVTHSTLKIVRNECNIWRYWQISFCWNLKFWHIFGVHFPSRIFLHSVHTYDVFGEQDRNQLTRNRCYRHVLLLLFLLWKFLKTFWNTSHSSKTARKTDLSRTTFLRQKYHFQSYYYYYIVVICYWWKKSNYLLFLFIWLLCCFFPLRFS